MRSHFGWKVAALTSAALVTLLLVSHRRPAAAEKRLETVRGNPVPVLVELFTSEGCSSCPPADIVLEQLQKEQPVEGGLVIALSEHVDYWNHLGWADPFSSRGFSDRQRGYGRAFGLDSVYTPQMVVNGRAEFLGSDRERAEAVISRAARAPHADVRVTSLVDTGMAGHLEVRVSGLPSNRSGDPVDVLLAITENNLRSSVARGENAGRHLGHTAVVRRLTSLGVASPGHPIAADPTLKFDRAWKRKDLSAVVFAQEHNSGHVLGAAEVSLK